VTARHWLIVPEDPEDDADVEHVDCPSMVTIYDQGEPCGWIADVFHGPDRPDGLGPATTSTYLCDVGAHLTAYGLDALDMDLAELPPGRYEIEAWSERYPSNPSCAEEWDGGICLTNPPPARDPDAHLHVPDDHVGTVLTTHGDHQR
jgi:hypothetical protein